MRKPSARRLFNDQLWQRLEPLIEKAKHSQAGAPGELSERDFMEAILYLNRTGCPWRDLPAEFGYWHAVYMRFRRWEERGVWARLWQLMAQEHLSDAQELFMDSTCVRAHQHAAGAPKKKVPIRLLGALGVG
jgi:transposase